MKTILFYFFVISPIMIFSQNFANIDFKGDYLKLYEKHIENIDLTNIAYNSSNASSLNLATGAFDGLLTIWEAREDINDLSLLEEFMKKADYIINLRLDNSTNLTSAPLWYKYIRNDPSDPNKIERNASIPFNGRVTIPLTHFIYIVNNNSQLKNMVITNPNLYGNHGSTYGEWSNWLENEVKKTFDYLLKNNILWGNTKVEYRQNIFSNKILIGNFEGIYHDVKNKRPANLNFQAPFGISFLYLYLASASRNYEYGVKCVKIAKLFLGKSFAAGGPRAFTYVPSYNSYYMLHDPWRGIDNNKYLVNNSAVNYNSDMSIEIIEDTRHAGWVVWFAELYNRHKTSMHHVTNARYFEDYHMVRLRNMFTNVIDKKDNCTSQGIEYERIHTSRFWISTKGGNEILSDYYKDAGKRVSDHKCNNIPFDYAILSKFDYKAGNIGPHDKDAIKSNIEFYKDEIEGKFNLPSLTISDSRDISFKCFKGIADLYNLQVEKYGKKDSKNYNEINNYLKIYPNPTLKFLTVELKKIGDFDIYIHDINGNKIYTNSENYTKNNIDISGFSKGMYIVIIYDKNSNKILESKKFQKI